MKYRFDELTLDLEAGRLEGPRGEVHLRPQTFRLLGILVAEAPRLLAQKELLDRVWGTEHLSSNSIRQAVSELRTALGDSKEQPRFIATVHGRGYRFVAPVTPLEAVADPHEARWEPATATPEPVSSGPPQKLEKRGRPRLAVAVALLAVLGFAALWLAGRSRHSDAGTPPRPSLAVLPFANIGSDPSTDWVGDTVGEVLRFELATSGGVRSVPGETVSRMQQELSLPRLGEYEKRKLRSVGTNLGVEWILTGSFLPQGKHESGQFLLQAQVQRAADATVIAWAQESCSTEELGLGVVRLARSIQSSLDLESSVGHASAQWMPDTQTLRLYSQAKSQLRREELEGARSLLEEALARSPENPLILDALASACSRLGFDSLARKYAQQALERADSLPRSLSLAIEARGLSLDGRAEEAIDRWQALWQFHPDDPENGLKLASEQRRAGRVQEGIETLAKLRETLPSTANDPRVSNLESALLADLSEFPRSRDLAQKAIGEAAERGSLLLAVDGHIKLSWALEQMGDVQGSLTALEGARALAVQAQNRYVQSVVLGNQARIFHRTDRLEQAEKVYRQVLDVLRQRGARGAEATALNNFASLLISRGNLIEALAAQESSIALKREIGDSQGLITSLANLSHLHLRSGDPEAASAPLEEAVSLARQLRLPEQLTLSLRNLGYLRASEEKYEIAMALFAESLEVAPSEEDEARSRFGLAYVAEMTGNLEEALEDLRPALAIYRRLELSEDVAAARNNLAEIQVQLGDLDEARAGFHEVRAIATALDSRYIEAHAQAGLGKVAEAEGDHQTAHHQHQLALRLFSELGLKKEADAARQALQRLSIERSST